ncbi:hypothetical protein [Stackebrandtia soli]|uniref:hypothetical protein n=1 Tax=Stackebrandtia soli TaxID=1892856 RepID=UPI0039E87B4D
MVQSVCAAIIGSLLSVGQILGAHALGAWDGTDRTHTVVVSAPIMIWTVALSVILGSVVPRAIYRGPSRRLTLSAMSAFGASLAAPVAAAVASWAGMYGGDLSQLDAVRLVFLGVALGCVASVTIPRGRTFYWALIGWSCVAWALLVAASTTQRRAQPVLGVLDPGPDWPDGSRLFQALLVAVFFSAVIGAFLGTASTVCQWGVPLGSRSELLRYVPTPWLAATIGPILAMASYVLAGLAGHPPDGAGLGATAVAVVGTALTAVAGSAIARAMFTPR